MYIKRTDSTVSKGGMNRELRVESKSERVRVSESKHEMRFQSFFYNNNECHFTPQSQSQPHVFPPRPHRICYLYYIQCYIHTLIQ